MRFATQLVLLFLPLYGFSQDMLFYDTLIKSRSGDFVKVKSVSELTGLVGTYSLQKGTWHYYGNEGNLLKEAQYKVNAKNRTSFLDGLVQYYDESGTRVLTQTFDNGQLETSIGFKHVILIEGITQIEIKKEYGDFVVVQHRDRFRESKSKHRMPTYVESMNWRIIYQKRRDSKAFTYLIRHCFGQMTLNAIW